MGSYEPPRKRAPADKAASLDASLRGMFRTLQSRPIPSHLRSVVDQLDEGFELSRLKKIG